MKKFENSQLYSIGGLVLMVLTVLLPFLKLTTPLGRGRTFDLGIYMLDLGKVHWLMYLLFIVGLAVLGYCIYITLFERRGFLRLALACGGYFVLLLVAFFIVKNEIVSSMGNSDFINMSFSIFTPLLAAGAYYMVEKSLSEEKAAV